MKLTEAQEYKTNLLEQALIQKSTKEKRAEWLKENRESLEAYSQRIEEQGVFSDGLRTF